MKIEELFEKNTKDLPLVLFIGFSKHKSLLSKELNCKFCAFANLKIDNDKKISINGIDLLEFKFILIGAIGKSGSIGKSVLNYIDGKVKYLKYGEIENKNDDKVYQQQFFKKHHINCPKTVVSKKSKTSSSELIKHLGLPLISKITNGSQGRGVNKFDSSEDLETFLNKGNSDETLIFQEFLPNNGDYRLFFFKHKLLFTIKRTSSDKKEFRNNISLGGTQQFVKLSKEDVKFASSIDRKFGLDFSGLDLIKKDNKWYVLEINAAPQFINKEKMVIPEIIDYIKSETKE